MTAQIIYGTDFKRANPKADRAFWIGPCESNVADLPALPIADTTPAEYCAPEKDPA